MTTTIEVRRFPSLEAYLANGMEWPGVDPDYVRPRLADVVVLEAVRLGGIAEAVAAEAERHARRSSAGERMRAMVDEMSEGPGKEAMRENLWHSVGFEAWVREMAAEPDLAERARAALPADVVEYHERLAVSERRPWVLEVEHREAWVCTATGHEGTGWVAVARPRMGDDAGDLAGHEVVLGLGALIATVEELRRRG